MEIHVVSIFPEAFPGVLGVGLVGKALVGGIWTLDVYDLREYASGKHRQVDDAAFGGGPGMVMKPEPLVGAVRALRSRTPPPRVILLSPQGRELDQEIVEELAQEQSLAFICGRYQGVDERAREEIGEELSIGKYIVSGGESAAMVVIEAIVRTLPLVIGDEGSRNETYSAAAEGGLEAPLYTRPADFEGKEVPAVLREGNHAAIEAWKREQRELQTHRLRPDLVRSQYIRKEERSERH